MQTNEFFTIRDRTVFENLDHFGITQIFLLLKRDNPPPRNKASMWQQDDSPPILLAETQFIFRVAGFYRVTPLLRKVPYRNRKTVFTAPVHYLANDL
jgi:hypothetical protein